MSPGFDIIGLLLSQGQLGDLAGETDIVRIKHDVWPWESGCKPGIFSKGLHGAILHTAGRHADICFHSPPDSHSEAVDVCLSDASCKCSMGLRGAAGACAERDASWSMFSFHDSCD